MFPYPSGSGLHAGHAYCYIIVDSYCKIQKYQGHNVYQPIGWDAFGLPTENYAIKMGRDAREVSIENIDNFKRQMEYMNTSFEEKLNTSSPEYIEKTQWIFTELLERGLAYKANREQCYCPSCKTILSNEQVIGSKIVDGLPLDGKCERCSTPIEPKEMEQWFFKITDYKQRLIDDLDKVDYPEKTKKNNKCGNCPVTTVFFKTFITSVCSSILSSFPGLYFSVHGISSILFLSMIVIFVLSTSFKSFVLLPNNSSMSQSKKLSISLEFCDLFFFDIY